MRTGAVKTQWRGRTIYFDRKTKKIFLTTAEFVETPAANSRWPTATHRQTCTFVAGLGK